MIKKILQENKIFKVIIFMVVLLIPVIYSFFYLKSYWDPYGNLKDIKVAMVNLDKGKRGKELIKSMQDADNTLGFEETTSEDALTGIAKDDYYAVITIPEDFTRQLESAGENKKQKAVITFTPNKRKNYLAYQIINSGLKSAEIELQSKVASMTVGTMSNQLKEIPYTLDSILDGVSQIEDGSESLTSGLNELSEGTNTLDNKYSEFDEGIKSATEGSSQLKNGISKSNEGITTLSNGTSSLDNGVRQINDALEKADTSKITDLASGIEQLNNGVNGEQGLSNGINSYINGVHTYEDNIESGAKTLQAGITKYVDGQNTLNQSQDKILQGISNYYDTLIKSGATPDETLTQLATGAKKVISTEKQLGLSEAGNNLKSGATQLANAKQSESFQKLSYGEKALEDGITKISIGIEQLDNNTEQIQSLGNSLQSLKINLKKVQEGTTTLNSGVSELKNGTNKIQEGANSLSNGLGELDANSSKIKTAIEQINNGAKTAYSGSTKLNNGIDTFREKIENGKAQAEERLETLNGLEEFIEDPVEFKEESFGEVESYGIGFTPLFLSIGLWVGALMLYVVLYYDQRHRFGILDHEKDNKILQNCIYLGIGAVEGIITGIILKYSLGFDVTNMGQYMFECILTGMAFTMIIQFLIRNFGDIGKFLALIILVLQLAASGGTFPVETIDKAFQSFTSWLPMTYTIRIFKDCLVKTDSSLIGGNTLVVLLILIILFALNLVIEFIKLKNTEEDEVENVGNGKWGRFQFPRIIK